MDRQLLMAGFPEFLAVPLLVAALAGLLKLQRCRVDWRQLRRLPGDQVGAVQSLSFVLTVPLFILIMLFIVQLSQITIGKIVVEYAAQTAARSARVWIPASLGPGHEQENQMMGLQYLGRFRDEHGVDFDRFRVANVDSEKMRKIHFAAALSCVSISPSRDVAATGLPLAPQALASLDRALKLYWSASANNPKVATRLAHKLNYALDQTRVQIEVLHRISDEPPNTYYAPRYDEFVNGEIGWQDQLVVSVEHQFALLPGPGRILARRATAPLGSPSLGNEGSDETAQRVRNQGRGLYQYALAATARVHNEGDKPALEYVQRYQGGRQWSTGSPRVITGSGPYRNRIACPECRPLGG
ncbi:MAG: pilus assembly protein [Planctomycetes bacterium]|nr:pilus assembly protein [Planctomycetota bacterium]